MANLRRQPWITHLLFLLLLAAISLSVQAASERPLAQPSDPLFSDQWNLHDPGTAGQTITADIRVLAAWDVTTGTPDTVIAILDSGVDLEHPDLASKIWINADEIPDNGVDDDDNGQVDDINGWDFVGDDDRPQDEDGWGTFMAGVAAAATNNGIGIAGIAWNTPIMPVRILTRDDMGQATAGLDDIVAGIRYAVDNGARIIHLGFYIDPDVQPLTPEQLAALETAIDEARDAGILLVSPVGDQGEGGNPTVYPAALPAVIGVTATDSQMERLAAAGYGPFVDLSAPGVNLFGVLPEGRYDRVFGGTELAAPHVAGVAALIWSVNPSLTPDQVREFMRNSADDLGTPGYDELYGFGLLNAAMALQMTPHLLQISPHELLFQVDEFGVVSPPTQRIVNPNTGGLTWQARTQARWLIIEGLTETTPSSVTVSINLSAIPNCGQYAGQIIAESNQRNQANGEQIVEVTLGFAKAACEKVYVPVLSR